MRVLILLAKHKNPATASDALNREIPRPEYLVLQEALDADLCDFSDVEASTHPVVRLARRRGLRHGLAALGWVKRRVYDHFYCTGEDVGFPFATLMLAALDLGRITLVVHNAGSRKSRLLLRAIPSAVWRNVICLSREQRRVLVEDLHIPAERVQQFPQWLDTRFYDPDLSAANGAPDYVLACGRENRDYETLQRAAQGLDIPFHVVASGWAPHAGFASTDSIRTGANITVESGSLSYHELRARYRAARLVVVPVNYVTYAAGVTSICEGMSMGKAIVATSSPGTRDYVEESVSGAVVAVGDADAMRDAIQRLWNDTEGRARMGSRNRAHARENFAVEQYAARVARLLGRTPKAGHYSTTYDA